MLNENAPHQAERRHRGAKAKVLVRMQEDGDKPPGNCPLPIPELFTCINQANC